MNYQEIFKKITKNDNGKIKGIAIKQLEEYKNIARDMRETFNNFTYQICPDNWELYKVDKNWQSSGYYKPYFWNQFKNTDINVDGISIWIKTDSNRIGIVFGTTNELEDDFNKDNINQQIWNKFSGKEYNNFIETNDDGFLNYNYIGEDENNDIEIFQKIILDLCNSYLNLINNILTKSKPIQPKKNKKIKNIILYGAPGVGKTHNYQRIITMIENGTSEKDIFNAITDNTNNEQVEQNNDIFKTIKDDKRVEFVTFHQNYSYEDFIEGFRPNEDGNIKLEDGIFKIIADKAENNLENSKKDIEEIIQVLEFKELFEEFKDLIQEELDKNGKFIINETAYIINIEKDAFRYKGDSWGNTQRMKFTDIELLNHLNIEERKEIKKLENISGLAKQHATYFSYLIKQFFKFKNNKTIAIPTVQKEKEKNFYIVIDEINRGNISKIFGELITLIEEDKRDNYEVTLPYSKESFKIPSNLYIIATMNSTDKSIATIDIALRRRFTFLKMKPNSNLVENSDAKKLMEDLNDYIGHKDNLGEDYKLGHSYFMKVQNNEDLDFVKEYKIKPLLEEYFYADDDKLEKVLEILK